MPGSGITGTPNIYMRSGLRGLALRQSLHIGLTALLATPLVAGLEDYAWFYATLLVTASALYSVQVKQPILLIRARELLITGIDVAARRSAQLREAIEHVLAIVEAVLAEAERDYERRWGYLGVLMGAVSTYVVATLFTRDDLVVAVLSLAIYDAASAVAGAAIGRTRLPRSRASVEGGAVGAAAYAASLILIGVDPVKAMLISVVAVLAEAYGVEDNLTLPIATALTSHLAASLW